MQVTKLWNETQLRPNTGVLHAQTLLLADMYAFPFFFPKEPEAMSLIMSLQGGAHKPPRIQSQEPETPQNTLLAHGRQHCRERGLSSSKTPNPNRPTSGAGTRHPRHTAGQDSDPGGLPFLGGGRSSVASSREKVSLEVPGT